MPPITDFIQESGNNMMVGVPVESHKVTVKSKLLGISSLICFTLEAQN
jgi:hypothetical protein